MGSRSSGTDNSPCRHGMLGTLRLKDKVAIVTGSSSGIGKAIALRFGQEGATVIMVARRLLLCERTVSQIREQGGEAWPIQTDVADEQQVERLMADTVTRYGHGIESSVLLTMAGYRISVGMNDIEVT